ncbi:MAG: D-alanyl-D-alanine carboxypeptidase [Clostridia bacterium]|nr:D-alanyl-D-alanine carboxypeptidase [Clostridia bacterium]
MFKKIFAACLAAACLITGANALEEPTINAKAAIIGETKTDTVVYEHNADDILYPASTTKIMTAILALEYGNLNDTVIVSDNAIDLLKDSGGSVMLKKGEQMNFRDMVVYLLVASGNDAANVLAEHISGSIPAFVELMNAKAQELGCTNTHFANPHGLHADNHYTTARDLLKIAEYAMQNEDFAQIVMIDKTVLPATNMHSEQTISNTNHLISLWRSRDYFYEGAIGIKTGSTTPAGYCLVSGVKSGDLTYITIVLGAEKAEDGTIGSFTETIKLLDYAKGSFEIQPMINSSDPVTEAPVALGKDTDSVVLVPENGFTALLPIDFSTDDVEVTFKVNENIKAPIEKGQALGTATYSYNGKEYTTINLVASEAVKRSTWLFIVDTIISIFTSTVFRIALGVLVLAVLVFILLGIFGRRRRRSRRGGGSTYRSSRRRRR